MQRLLKPCWQMLRGRNVGKAVWASNTCPNTCSFLISEFLRSDQTGPKIVDTDWNDNWSMSVVFE